MTVINAGSTAWVLVSAALVMLMTPGLALFYGGLVRSKSVLNIMMMSLVCLGVVGVLWAVFGYSLAFGEDLGDGIGGLDHVGPRDAAAVVGPASDRIPLLAFAMFELMFAVITAALLAGAIADRARFWSWTLFVALWVCLVYFPLAHWVFAVDGYAAGHGGWIVNRLKALDFAGGTVVEINSGASALALALVLGRRRGWPKDPMRPHNMPNVLLGGGLLWFGWFGFNAGSALAVGAVAANAFETTMTASAAAVISWLIYEQVTDGRPTTLGAASGAIAGLVAIMGLFATVRVNPAGADGLFYGGGLGQLGRQVLAALVAMCYAFAVSLVLAWLVRTTVGFRMDRDVEHAGIDEAEHAESGYDLSTLGSAGRGSMGLVQLRSVTRQPQSAEEEDTVR